VVLSLTLLEVNGQTSAQESWTAERPWIGNPGVQETTGQIMARDSLAAANLKPPQPAPRHLLPPEAGSSTVTGSPSLPQPLSPHRLNAQIVNSNLNFTGANFNDCSGWPPDTMGAIGPTQFILALNGRIRSFNKTNGLADGAIN